MAGKKTWGLEKESMNSSAFEVGTVGRWRHRNLRGWDSSMEMCIGGCGVGGVPAGGHPTMQEGRKPANRVMLEFCW